MPRQFPKPGEQYSVVEKFGRIKNCVAPSVLCGGKADMDDRSRRNLRPSTLNAEQAEHKNRLEWLGSVAYASISQIARRPPNQWDAVSVRAADLLWRRLDRRDRTQPFKSSGEARAFADSVRKWARKDAWREVERGSKAWNHQQIVDSSDPDFSIPQVTLPNDPADLAVQAEIDRAVEEVIAKHRSWRVRAVAVGLKEGLTLAEIDQKHGGRASSRAWNRALAKLREEVRRRLADFESSTTTTQETGEV